MPTKKQPKELDFDQEERDTSKELKEGQRFSPESFIEPTGEAEQVPEKALFKGRQLAKDIKDKDGFYITHNISGEYSDRYIPDTADGSGAAVDTTEWIAEFSNSYDEFFIADRPCEIVRVRESHVGTSAAHLTLKKLTSGQGRNSGVNMLNTTIDMTTAASTPVLYGKTELSATLANRILDAGDRMAVVESVGSLSGMRSVNLTIYLVYRDNGDYHGV